LWQNLSLNHYFFKETHPIICFFPLALFSLQ
jgi:hypothetical protein